MYRIRHIFTRKYISQLDGNDNPIYASSDEEQAFFNFQSDANAFIARMSFVQRALHQAVLISEDF